MRTESIRLAVSSILICLMIASCKDSTIVEPPKVEEPPDLRNAIVPLAIGNSWTYLDTLITDTDTTVQSYTQSVTAYRFDKGLWWWKISNSANAYYTEWAVRSDSLFAFQSNELGPIVALEYIPLSSTDSVRFPGLIGGDIAIEKLAYRLPGQFAVPAGSFDSCLAYYYSFGVGDYQSSVIIRPRVGFVSQQLDINDRFSGYRASRRIRLSSYHLN